MHKKRILGSISIGLIAVTLVGGTLAWFTDTDEKANKFTTGKVDISVVETFEEPSDWTPGTQTNKDVAIKNEGKSAAFIRVKLETGWYDENGLTNLSNENISTKIVNAVVDKVQDGMWVYNKADQYYYYMGKVKSQESTKQLVDHVTFMNDVPGLKDNDNDYAGKELKVNVVAEAIQVTNKAYRDAWKGASEDILKSLDALSAEQ